MKLVPAVTGRASVTAGHTGEKHTAPACRVLETPTCTALTQSAVAYCYMAGVNPQNCNTTGHCSGTPFHMAMREYWQFPAREHCTAVESTTDRQMIRFATCNLTGPQLLQWHLLGACVLLHKPTHVCPTPRPAAMPQET